MINLLSPETKKQITYSQRNSVLLRYLGLVLVMGILLGAILYFSLRFADQQISQSQQVLTEKQTTIESYKDLQQQATEVSAKFSAIDSLLKSQMKFSALLEDLADVMPSGTYINGLSLTGDSKKPVSLSVTVQSYSQAGVVRNALVGSKRIKSADIQSVTEGPNGLSAEMVIAFNEEAL
ncbi:MAG: PilN domain-containing protein [Candidatus Saccharimonadales bacterium]